MKATICNRLHLMLVKTTLTRKFIMNTNGQSTPLPDPDPQMTQHDVLNFYSRQYPLLTTAKVVGPTFGVDCLEFIFDTVLGTKG